MWIIFVVAVGAAWLWHQEAGRRQLATEVDGLKSRLSAAGHSGKRPEDRLSEPRTGLEGEPIDWVALATKFKTGGDIAGGLLNKNARLLAALESKSVDELLAMLDQIAAADLSKRERDVLERALVSILVKKAPEVAFSRFSVEGRSDWCFFLGSLYRQWLKQDSSAAVAWLRKRAEGGEYFSPEMVRIPFFDLLESEPGISAEVLASVRPEGRLESLRCLGVARLQGGGQKEWADVIRKVLPEVDRAEAISWPLGNWSDGDGAPMNLDQVDAYFERIGATKAERDACIMAVAEDHGAWVRSTELNKGANDDGLEGLDRFREWVSEREPSMLESATLRALEEIASDGDVGVAAERAIEFKKASGNDVYLCRVLDKANDLADVAAIREMIEQLSDPALQAAYREKHSSRLKKE